MDKALYYSAGECSSVCVCVWLFYFFLYFDGVFVVTPFLLSTCFGGTKKNYFFADCLKLDSGLVGV